MYIYINNIYIIFYTHIYHPCHNQRPKKKNRAWPRMQGDYPGVLLVDLGAPSQIVPWIPRNGCRKWFSRYLKRIVHGFSVPKIHEYPSMSTFFSPTLWIQLYLLRKWDWGIIYYNLEAFLYLLRQWPWIHGEIDLNLKKKLTTAYKLWPHG